jgi:hypothetical protein
MPDSTKVEEPHGWYRRFVEHLDPGERMGELLFGLIMVLTFTLGAGLEMGDREETRDLLIAALGCNTAWGIIDAALYLIARLSERGRLHRLVKSIQTAPTSQRARARGPGARRAAAGDREAGGAGGRGRARARAHARAEARAESGDRRALIDARFDGMTYRR